MRTEMMAVCCEDDNEHKRRLCGQNAQILFLNQTELIASTDLWRVKHRMNFAFHSVHCMLLIVIERKMYGNLSAHFSTTHYTIKSRFLVANKTVLSQKLWVYSYNTDSFFSQATWLANNRRSRTLERHPFLDACSACHSRRRKRWIAAWVLLSS
jgi:hypothetical protein